MKYLLLINLILFTVGCTNNYQIVANSTLAIDYLQTKEIGRSNKYYEKNKLLGKYPTQREINKHFVGAAIVTNGIGMLLKEEEQDIYFGTLSIIGILNVVNNKRIGIEIQF